MNSGLRVTFECDMGSSGRRGSMMLARWVVWGCGGWGWGEVGGRMGSSGEDWALRRYALVRNQGQAIGRGARVRDSCSDDWRNTATGSRLDRMSPINVILDTNVFVAAGFRPTSASARLIALARDGLILLVWDRPTRAETRRILEKIPRLSWGAVEELFTDEGEFRGGTRPADFELVRDAEDRKFAALAAATGVVVVSSDEDLLEHRGSDAFAVRTPGEMVRWVEGGG